jgi:hypothetical protein
VAGPEPTVVVLVGGGDVTRAELVEHLRRGRRLVIVTGTGRLADDLANGNVGDADLRALLASGNVKQIALSAGPRKIARGVKTALRPTVRRRWQRWTGRWVALSVFPRWPFRPGPPDPLLDGAATQSYPTLAARARDLDAIVFPAFARQDSSALVEQNRYRWFEVLAIFGGLLTTVFGAAQAWLQSARWPGVVVATLAAATTALSTVARRQDARQHFLTARVRAERLRALYFETLTRPVADPSGERLEVKVANMESSKLA